MTQPQPDPRDLIERAVPLADGWHLKRRDDSRFDDVWDLVRPNGKTWFGDGAEAWREMGQPIPQPVPSPVPVREGPEGLSEAQTRHLAQEWTDEHIDGFNTAWGVHTAMMALARACREAVAGWDGQP